MQYMRAWDSYIQFHEHRFHKTIDYQFIVSISWFGLSSVSNDAALAKLKQKILLTKHEQIKIFKIVQAIMQQIRTHKNYKTT